MKKYTQEEIIVKFRKIHGHKYDYSKVIYLGIFIKVIIICPVHGEFKCTPHNHLHKKGCKKCMGDKIGNLKRSNINDFIQKASEFHNNKFGYDNFIYKDSQTKGYVTCEKHGDYLVSPNNHLRGKGCPQCNIDRLNNNHHNKLTTEQFIQKAKAVHGNNNDYSECIYKNAHKKIKIKCLKKKNHGYYYQKPNNHLNGQGCPKCRKSKGEIRLIEIFDKYNITWKDEFKLPGYNFEYDFYLPDHNLLIEFHGKQHYEPIKAFGGEKEFKEVLRRDAFKRSLARDYRIPLIEIHYNQLEKLSREQFEQLVINKIKH